MNLVSHGATGKRKPNLKHLAALFQRQIGVHIADGELLVLLDVCTDDSTPARDSMSGQATSSQEGRAQHLTALCEQDGAGGLEPIHCRVRLARVVQARHVRVESAAAKI